MLGALVIVSFGNLLKAVSLFFEGRVEPGVILEWFVKRTPEDMQYIFPVATMLATLLVFSSLSRTSELVALRAAGISLARMMLPVLAFSGVVTGGVFWFLDQVVPGSMRRSQELWDLKIKANAGTPRFRDNVLLRDSANRLVFAGRFNLQTSEMEHVKIRDYAPSAATGNRFQREFSARRALHRGGKLWELQDVRILVRAADGETLYRKDSQTMPMGADPEEIAQVDRPPQQMEMATLVAQIRKLDERGLANTLPLKVELYLKASFPFCIPIFAVIGSAMGITSARSGGFIGFGMSLVATFSYYVVMSLSASMGKTGVIHPLLASWLHNVVFALFAAAITIRSQWR
jgi:lipopolysaccharide export system permease protein